MKNYFILTCLLALSCGDGSSNQGKPYFIFDKIDYYHLDITEKEATHIGSKEAKTRKEEALVQLLNGNVPTSTIDTLFIRNMEILSFKKLDVNPKLNPGISKIFAFREVENPVAAACEPIYRDILVFREKGKIVGMAKICFACGLNQIVGAKFDASEFGNSGEYGELYNILKPLAVADTR